MQLLISITTKPETKTDLNELFVIYDTHRKQVIRKLKFKNNIRKNANDAHRATGMCYYENFWYAGIFCAKHRVGSKLLIIDLNNGIQTIADLSLTKAIHSIYPLCKCKIYNMILACSTQNDCISIITTWKTKVITEDIYFDYLDAEKRLTLDWSLEYVWDDLLHANCVYVNNGDVYSCMFLDFKIGNKSFITRKREHEAKRANAKRSSIEKLKKEIEIKRNGWRENKLEMQGAVYNLTTQNMLALSSQPHSLIVNQFNEKVFCESGTFKLINIDRNKEAQCKGFTRGLYEDKQRGGYWVGLSYHRVFSYKLKGAALQFVDYDMQVKETLDLSSIGKEIYDIIPFKNNKNWGVK
jgi:hypothetical protein